MSPDVQATFCATLVDEWIRRGLCNAVIAPGSRSTPMAVALAARDELHIEVAHDERTAAFMALGIGIATGRPALVLCTSGTAATHFHAAVVEADLASVPLIVLTADRPPELQGVGAPQTINQTRLYGGAVRWFHDVGVPADAGRGTWRTIAAHAGDISVHPHPGPVHLNLPFREPLLGAPDSLPEVNAHPRVPPVAPSVDVAMLVDALDRPHGIIIAGRLVDSPDAMGALAAALGWPILADPLSGCRRLPGAITAYDAVLRHEGFAAAHRPEVVLHVGELPASKVLAEWLVAADALYVHVHPYGRVIDPQSVVDRRVHASASALCTALGSHRWRSDVTWLGDWRAAGEVAVRVIDDHLDSSLSEPTVARTVAARPGPVVVSSSMPVRDVEWFAGPTTGRVYANRGANGIDGVMATAIGVAVGSGEPTTVLLGDVAFCHDASSLTALARRAIDLTIVVVDNDGGGIFSFLPQADQLDSGRFERLFGTPHGTDIVGVAAAHGIPARSVSSIDELQVALGELGTSLIRVASNRVANVDVHRTINTAVVAALVAELR